MTHTISIVMATYNGARWIRAQLDSFAAQTRLPDEVVITDDGSSDDTAGVVAAFAAVAPFAVRFTTNPERLGFNGNFARAIGLAGGDVVFISDQDDVWYREKIARVIETMETTAYLCVVNGQAIADAAGRETGGTVLGNVRALRRPDQWYGPGCCTAFSRALMPLILPLPGDVVAYDRWINTLADTIGRRCLLETPLQLYRRHDSNASGSVFARERPGLRDLLRAARLTDAVAAITAKVAEIDALLDRLATPAAASLALPAAYGSGMSALRAERDDYANRLTALRRNRTARLPLVWRLWAEGRYARFSGAVTAIKDLVS